MIACVENALNRKLTSSKILVVAPRRGQDLISVCKSEGEDFTGIIFDYNSDKSLAYEGRIGTYFALTWALVLVLSGIERIIDLGNSKHTL